MKSKTAFFLVMVGFIGASLYFFGGSTSTNASLSSATTVDNAKSVAILPLVKSSRVEEVYQAARTPLDVPKEKEVSAKCLNFWQGLRAANMKELFQVDAKKDLLAEKTDCKVVPDKLTEIHERFLKYCGEYGSLDRLTVDSEKYRSLHAACYVGMTLYRAQITDFLTADEDLDKIMDPKILADKTISAFTESPKRAADAADRLLELEPTLYPAAKVSAIGRLLDARSQKNGKLDAIDWEKVESALERAKKMSPNEDQKDQGKLREIELVLLVSKTNNPEKVKERATQMAAQHPNSGEAHYFLAWAADKGGNRAEAIRQLTKAAEAEPTENRYKAALNLYQQPASNDGQETNVFGTNLSLPLDSLIPESQSE